MHSKHSSSFSHDPMCQPVAAPPSPSSGSSSSLTPALLHHDINSNIQPTSYTKMRREVGSRRVEKEFIEWLKILFEIIYGCIMTLFYILLEISQLVYPKKSKSLAGQHILVTGAARGLGREICLRLVREGCSLTLVDVWKEGVEETAQLCNQLRPATATPLYCDITDRKQVSELVSKVAPVDILINNAGIVSSAGILEVTEEHIEKMMNVNVMAHYWTIRAFLPGMIQRGRGHIVAVASAAAFTAAANIAPYTATKYAVTGLMASLREEFRHFYPKIKTTTIHPFFITPPNSNVDHWDKTSRLPDVTAVEVAERTVRGIKKERITVTIPHHLYFLLMLLHFLPSTAGELWRDMFYAKINPLDKTKVKTS